MLEKLTVVLVAAYAFAATVQAQTDVAAIADEIEPQVIQWRRHIHQNPELSNREFETAKYVEDFLSSLGMEVQTGVAITGVVAYWIPASLDPP